MGTTINFDRRTELGWINEKILSVLHKYGDSSCYEFCLLGCRRDYIDDNSLYSKYLRSYWKGDLIMKHNVVDDGWNPKYQCCDGEGKMLSYVQFCAK